MKEGFQGFEYNYVEWPESHERSSIAREEAAGFAKKGEEEREVGATVWKGKRMGERR